MLELRVVMGVLVGVLCKLPTCKASMKMRTDLCLQGLQRTLSDLQINPKCFFQGVLHIYPTRVIRILQDFVPLLFGESRILFPKP